jgi:WD40 repeat protein
MPDGVHVVSGSQDQSLRVWDLRAGAAIAAFSGENPMFSCAAAPDNKTLIAGEFSGRVHILRLEGIGTAE